VSAVAAGTGTTEPAWLGQVLKAVASGPPAMSMSEALASLSCPSARKSIGRPLGATALAIRDAVDELTTRYERMTVRQVFYQLETMGIVGKTEAGYRQVQMQVLKMRREGLLDWTFITDGTRWKRKPRSYSDAGDYIEQVSRSYRRDLWQEQDVRIEIWLEKDALADVIVDVTAKWDVSLMVSRGQSSATFLHSAAVTAREAFEDTGVSTYVYALYDFDAGGERAYRTVEHELPTHAPGVPIYVERLAVTEDQIEEWGLSTRPAKKSDPEAAKWGDKPAVELDAVDPDRLTGLVEEAITYHVDKHAWEVEQQVEAEERAGVLALALAWQPNGDGAA
jgi:hypothetical protein